MWKLFKLSYQHAYWVILAFAVLTVAGFWQARNLSIEVSSDELIPLHSPLRQQYESVKSQFGSDHVALIYAQDEQLFTHERLSALDHLGNRLAALPTIQRVESLFTVSNIRGAGGMVDTSPIFQTIPTAPEELHERKEQALANPLLRGNLVSPDGQATVLTLYLDEPENVRVYDHEPPPGHLVSALPGLPVVLPASRATEAHPGRTPSASEFQEIVYYQIKAYLHGSETLREQARAIAGTTLGETVLPDDPSEAVAVLAKSPLLTAELEAQGDHSELAAVLREPMPALAVYGYNDLYERLFQIGQPALQVLMADYILADQYLLMPLAGLILILLIGLLLQSVHGALLPLINAVIAVGITAGLMALAGVPVNMLNYIVPVLILVIGATEDVHILAEYRAELKKNPSPLDAITATGHNMGLTILLTCATTVLGFAVNGLNEILIMQYFGFTAAAGMLARFLTSTVFLPAYLRLFGRGMSTGKAPSEPALPPALAEKFSDLLMHRFVRHRWRVIGVFVLISIPALFFSQKITFSNDLVSFLKKDSPIVERLNTVSEHLAGTKVIYVTLEGNRDAFRQPENLQQLARLTQNLRGIEGLDSVISLADYLALTNQAMFNGDAEEYRIPDNQALIAQYLLFFHRSELRPYISGDFSSANIVIRTNINDSHRINEIVAGIRQDVASGSYGAWVSSVTGQSVIVAASVEKLATGQVLSLGFMVGFLFVIVAVLFISTRCAVLAVLSNLFPVAAVFGIMGVADIPLNVGTCMVAAITIGIAVDDTLHLMVRYNRDLKRLKNEHKAIAASATEEFLPVSITSMALAGGFLVLGFSSFVPVYQFGILSAVVIFLAVVADLVLTPVLLSTTRLITLWDLIGFQLRRNLMQRSQLFQGLSSWQAKKLILACDIEEVSAGATLIHEGETGNCMYVILEGQMDVFKNTPSGPVPINTLDLGEAIGEIAIITSTKRTANVVAKTDCRLLVLDWDSLLRLQRFAPYLSSRLFLNLANILGNRLVGQLGKIDTRSPFPPNPKPPDTSGQS